MSEEAPLSDYADFGRYLAQQRELRGLSVNEVQKTTRIPSTILAALEGGDVDRLPARVFILNYIRAYAQAIGMAPEEAVLRFEEMDRTVKSSPPPAVLERQRRRRAWITLACVLLAAAAAVSALVWTLGGAPAPRP
ncbi:MAG TPA: helix-turn-helix domain-containing protein [Myxococcales bacterium]|nr:helix-turn-helix domain-containing protein [Myxococcales bacterium]